MPFLLKPRKNPALTTATLLQNRHLQVSLHNIMSRFIESLIYLSYSHVKILQTWCHILKKKSKTYQGEMLSASRLILQKENKEGWKNNICLLLGLWSSHVNVWSSVNQSSSPWSLNSAFLSAAKVIDGPICGKKLLPCDVFLLHFPLLPPGLPIGLLPLSHRVVTSLPCPEQPLAKISLASLAMVHAWWHPSKSLCLQTR